MFDRQLLVTTAERCLELNDFMSFGPRSFLKDEATALFENPQLMIALQLPEKAEQRLLATY